MIEHKHLIIRAEIDNPPKDPEFAKQWLRELVDKIGMKLIDVEHNPISGYVDIPGNRGLTAVAMIQTSHIALHVWDEEDPSLLQLDVYTCSSLSPTDVFDHMEQFGILAKSFLYLDRENTIQQIVDV